MLEVLAKRGGEYVLVVPVPLDTSWERYFGGQYWLRANVSGTELRLLYEVCGHGGILAKDPRRVWVSLTQSIPRLTSGMDWDESIAIAATLPAIFYKFYCRANEGKRSWVRWCADFILEDLLTDALSLVEMILVLLFEILWLPLGTSNVVGVPYVRPFMAFELGEQVWRRHLLQSPKWMLEVLAKRGGEYVLVVPVPLDTSWERYFGGQYGALRSNGPERTRAYQAMVNLRDMGVSNNRGTLKWMDL